MITDGAIFLSRNRTFDRKMVLLIVVLVVFDAYFAVVERFNNRHRLYLADTLFLEQFPSVLELFFNDKSHALYSSASLSA